MEGWQLPRRWLAHHIPGGCAARNRGADFVEHLVPSLRAGTRYSTGHRELHKQTAFACTAPGAGQHRDSDINKKMKSIKKTVEKYIQSNKTILNYLLTKEKNFTSENEHPLNIEFYKVRQECYQAFIKDLNEILKKVNVSIEKKSKKSKK